MTIRDDVLRLMNLYPKIFFACHLRHVRDPRTRSTVSAHQASILDHLDDIDGTSVSALAEHMGVTPSTMSLSIDRLEHKGYVHRTRDPSDRRRVVLRLTKAGARMKGATSVLDPGLVRAMLRTLTPHERHTALEGLAILAHAARATMADQSRARSSWRRP